MEIINSIAATIDIGNRPHFVAVGQSLDDVKEFGVYAEDLIEICEWLQSYEINYRLLVEHRHFCPNIMISGIAIPVTAALKR